MAARVMLLILMIGVFIALWSGDHQHQAACVSHSETKRPEKSHHKKKDTSYFRTGQTVVSRIANSTVPNPSLSAEANSHAWDLLVSWLAKQAATRAVEQNSEPTDRAVSNPESEVAEILIPLPGGITPGDYRIARSDGHVSRVTITADDLARREMQTVDPPQSLYRLHDGQHRWYFIRLESESVTITNHTPDSVESTPVAAKKPLIVGVARRPRAHSRTVAKPLPMQQTVASVQQWVSGKSTLVHDFITARSVDVIHSWRNWGADSLRRLRQAAAMVPRLAAKPRKHRQ